MPYDSSAGQIVILNGAPRSGKSSIAKAIQEHFDGPWMNLGVDAYNGMTPERYLPGIGLRPGGERPDLEEMVPFFYAALYESIAIHAGLGLNIVADLGHHDSYSQPLGILADCARRLEGLPVLFVGVRCPIEVIMKRREIVEPGRETLYVRGGETDAIPEPVRLWQKEVHIPGIYDMELDTAVLTPAECAEAICHQLDLGIPQPSAFEQLAGLR
ncbi:chloramphenicol phosphotransferase [Rhizobium grahamii]|uniref:Chloramphenicol phosphotransferase n=1 Tax=Rhizobium grahamii TaxID=1120045 RepID=A0A5Q0C5G0_9HYPH|nr:MULTISPECIES: chloramphenicol phosphotransferase [Rhizobium]QFY59287.1 chloramphenicol phosphotransferase [Rhizobium grahamii]QRM48184.1 chloramphenicol phosphotransferase [Rhizobium sp. BG6]